MHTLDSIRQQIGVTYPQDGPASAPRAAVQVGHKVVIGAASWTPHALLSLCMS